MTLKKSKVKALLLESKKNQRKTAKLAKISKFSGATYISVEHGSLVCKFWHKFNLICLSSNFLVICLFLHFYKAFLICVFSHFIVFKSNFAMLSYLFFSFPFHIFTFFISYPWWQKKIKKTNLKFVKS